MSDWDSGSISTSMQRLGTMRDPASRESRTTAMTEFMNFIRSYREDGVFVYRDMLLQQYRKGEPFLEIDLDVLSAYSAQLHDLIASHPNELWYIVGYLVMRYYAWKARFVRGGGGHIQFEDAARNALAQLVNRDRELEDNDEALPRVQIVFSGEMQPTMIRDLSASDVNRLLQVPGIVISASRTVPKASEVCIRCTSCGDSRMLPVAAGFGGFTLPRQCLAMKPSPTQGEGNPGGQACPLDPYVVVGDQSKYVDHQTLKLQEAPEQVPTGEMPRHLLLSVERALVDRVAPGTRVSVFGIASIFRPQGKSARGGASGGLGIRHPFLRVAGIMVEEAGSGRALTQFSPEEEAEFRAKASEPDLYNKLAQSVAPAISGDYTDDIKRAILALLFGGSRKLLPDNMRLRGDINVLLLGDPSTAKSQFLKFVERVAPVGVYTSGKGSSAAGLTASVVRDQRGEFYLEGGAMVLADGGVVCIDEFDKMREEDRVAIHEAMEQQTISVAKAGITTILNSRSAVLAAANPVFGRYDDDRSAAENIDFLPTILSRFDLIFIVRDVRNTERDEAIAHHVMRVHINAGADDAAETSADVSGDWDLSLMKRYIAFARSKCAPRLSEEAARVLRDNYVEIRNGQRARKRRDMERTHSDRDSVVPITVRQLEALIRIAESLAKMTLSPEAGVNHVKEAIRLFQVSTLDAANSGLGQHYMSPETRNEVQRIEERIQRTLPLFATTATRRLKSDLLRQGFSDMGVGLAFRIMAGRNELDFLNEKRTVRRVR